MLIMQMMLTETQYKSIFGHCTRRVGIRIIRSKRTGRAHTVEIYPDSPSTEFTGITMGSDKPGCLFNEIGTLMNMFERASLINGKDYGS